MPLDLRKVSASENVEKSLVVIPVGSMEQHCDLPVGTDCLIAEALSWRTCNYIEKIENIRCFIAPPICYGYSPEWKRSWGTISLELKTFSNLLKDVIKGLIKWGFKKIVILNAHGGNSNIISAVLSEIVSEIQENEITLAQVDYWKVAGFKLGHGDLIERSILKQLLNIEIDNEIKCDQAKISEIPGLKIFTKGSKRLEILEVENEGSKVSINLDYIIVKLSDAFRKILSVDTKDHYIG
jgi:creatinine amidohydrolase/Fe(II)-dependent formamide hydrolase-like protein